MREARIDGNVLAIDYRWLMGGTQVRAHTGYEGHRLGYSLRYSQLSRWQEFEAAARRLLGGFVVDADAK